MITAVNCCRFGWQVFEWDKKYTKIRTDVMSGKLLAALRVQREITFQYTTNIVDTLR